VLALFPESAAMDGAELTIGGVSAGALAEQHGTPVVVVCEGTLRANARALRAAVGDGRIFFGTKAFPNVALLRLLHEERIGADVASAGELAFARAAGLGGVELVVHGNNKDGALPRSERPSSSTHRTSRAWQPRPVYGRRSSGSRSGSTPTRTRRSERVTMDRSSGSRPIRHGRPSPRRSSSGST
jgi:pyridoxal-dependent decarboxylase-like protein